MRKLKIILVLLLFFPNCSISKNRIYLIQPKDMFGITETSFYCYGKKWGFQESLKPTVRKNILYFHFKGSNRNDHTFSYTEEPYEKHIDQNPIPFAGKKNFVIEIDNKIMNKLYFDISITNNEYYICQQRINAKNNSIIRMALPSSGKDISSIVIFFVGEPCDIGIKSIYLE